MELEVYVGLGQLYAWYIEVASAFPQTDKVERYDRLSKNIHPWPDLSQLALKCPNTRYN